jgi:hypothetical protein
MNAKIDPEGDEDWFWFELSEPLSVVTMDVNLIDVSRLQLTLYDNAVNALSEGRLCGSATWYVPRHNPAGIYYLRASSCGSGSYQLNVRAKLPHPDEPNDDRDHATPLVIDQLHDGDIAWGYEEDWYRVANPREPRANTGVLLQIGLSRWLSLEASDADGNGLPMDQTTDPNGNPQYFVRVDGPETFLRAYSDNAGAYQILVTASDSEEPNDTLARSIPLRPGESARAELGVPGDFDFYWCRYDTGILTAEVKPGGKGWAPVMELYTSWWPWWPPLLMGTMKLSWPASWGRPSYLRVDDLNRQGGPDFGYTITLSLQPSDGCSLWGGGIYDKHSGRQINHAFVVVTTPKGAKVVRGPIEGFPTMAEIPAGEYTVKVMALGYQPWTRKLKLVRGQSVDLGSIDLTPKPIKKGDLESLLQEVFPRRPD